MGPAFVPTEVRNLGEFENLRKENQDFYVPFTAKQYLKSAGTVTIVRVLHLGGYANDSVVLTISGSVGHRVAAILKPSRALIRPRRNRANGLNSFIKFSGTKDSFVLNLDTNSAEAQLLHYHLIQVQQITLQKCLVKIHKTQTKQFMCIQISKIQQMQVSTI